MKYCRQCGEQLSDDVKFCTKCGTPCMRETSYVQSGQADQAQSGQDSRNSSNNAQPGQNSWNSSNNAQPGQNSWNSSNNAQPGQGSWNSSNDAQHNPDIKKSFTTLSKDVSAEVKRKFNTKPKIIAGVIIAVVAILLLVSFVIPLKSNSVVGEWELYATRDDDGWLTVRTSYYGEMIEEMECSLDFERNGDVTFSAYGEEEYGTWKKTSTESSSIEKIYTIELDGEDEEIVVYFRDKDYDHLYFEEDGELEAMFTRPDTTD